MSDLKKFRVTLVETVRYFVDVEAEDEQAASEAAQEEWAHSSDPTNDFCGQGEGVTTSSTWENPPNWKAGGVT